MAADKKAVTFHYTLRDDEGTVIDSSDGKKPLTYLHGAGNIVPGLEKALEGKKAGGLQIHHPRKTGKSGSKNCPTGPCRPGPNLASPV